MQRIMMKSKIHRATVTGADLDYEGSITIDKNLLEAADIKVNEQVQVLNINNGQRFITYAIEAPAGSKTILLNGPAARLALPGDIVIVIAYANVDESEIDTFEPKVILLDKDNNPK